MKIAPLQWVRLLEDENWWGAEVTPLNLSYEVRETSRGTIRVRWPRMSWENFDGTLEDAKAAATADLQRRISRVVTSSEDDA